MKFNVRVATPPGYEPAREFVDLARHGGAEITLTQDAEMAVQGADVLITDTWVSMGLEHTHHKLAATAPYHINQALISRASNDAIFTHLLTAMQVADVRAGVFAWANGRGAGR